MKRLVIAALALVAVFTVAGSALAASSQSATIYDSTVNVGPKSNLSSDGLEATAAAQIGSKVALQSSSKRKLTSATVTLSSWACANGHWGSTDNQGNATCVTPVGATYSLPITLNIYDEAGSQLLTSKTQTFNVSYRPSANPKCGTSSLGSDRTKWYSTTDKKCFNGLAQDVTFTFDGTTTTTLPDHFSYGIAYGTSHYGSPSSGVQDCTLTPAGCFYDSLNVAEVENDDAAKVTQFLTDSGAPTLGIDSGYTPAVQFKAGS
jgi:hypothetical protein